MAELFSIVRITVGVEKLTARVLVNPEMPLMTSEDIEATARIYYLAPAIASHACLGDAGAQFKDCMADTELAHLLEHLSVEIMIETGCAGRIACGRTRAVADVARAYDIELSCPDDVLAIGAVSCAMFMMDWAYLHGDQTSPDMEGTVAALRDLIANLRGSQPDEADNAGSIAPEREMIDVEGAQLDGNDGDGAADAVFGGVAAQRASGHRV